MDERELLKERFKSAVSSAVKAISENFDLEIKFDNSVTSKKKLPIRPVLILASASDSEASDKDIDILSNGFKIRVNNSENNTSGKTYIYMAFAEQPFVNSKGVPANAR